jgi:hypothetical protein
MNLFAYEQGLENIGIAEIVRVSKRRRGGAHG